MANKKYTEFPDAPFNPDNITLQADPATGALSKYTQRAAITGQRTLYFDADTHHSVEDETVEFYNYDLPINFFQNIGDSYNMYILGWFYPGVPNARLRFYLGAGETSFDFADPSNNFELYQTFYLTSGLLLKRKSLLLINGAYNFIDFAGFDYYDPTAPLNTRVTLEASGDAAIRLDLRQDIFTPAAFL